MSTNVTNALQRIKITGYSDKEHAYICNFEPESRFDLMKLFSLSFNQKIDLFFDALIYRCAAAVSLDFSSVVLFMYCETESNDYPDKLATYLSKNDIELFKGLFYKQLNCSAA